MTILEKIVIIFIIICILFAFWWIPYSYKDCKKVGHSTTYCIIKIFSI